jgi:hypothetical protein
VSTETVVTAAVGFGEISFSDLLIPWLGMRAVRATSRNTFFGYGKKKELVRQGMGWRYIGIS